MTFRLPSLLPRAAAFLLLSAGLAVAAEPSAPPIVGGTVAATGAYPWQVALLSADVANNFNAQFCGGSLIAPTWVLTAAHCVAGETASSIEVLVGTNSLTSGGTRIAVSQVIAHENYSSTTDDSDVALLKLATAATQTTIGYLNTANEASYAAPGTVATISGWGALSEAGSNYPSVLYAAQVPIVSNTVCNGDYGGSITANMLCAGFDDGGVDTCQGDSGGPLVVPNGSGYLLAGVTSFGIGCARSAYYGVYARVARFAEWIKAKTGTSGGGTTKPGTPVVIRPTGVIADMTPTIVWRSMQSAGVTRYQVEIRRSGAVKFRRDVAPVQAGCSTAAASQCRFTPNIWLYGSGYSVRVRAYAKLWSDWSTRQTFTVRKGVKLATTTRMEAGDGRWTWDAVAGAERYLLVGVDGEGRTVAHARVAAAEARCADGTGSCRIAALSAPAKIRSWWVRAGAGKEWGPVSGAAAE